MRDAAKAADPDQYKDAVIGLIFLKHLSDKFMVRRSELAALVDNPTSALDTADEAARKKGVDDREEYSAEGVFWIPDGHRWDDLRAACREPDIGRRIDAAMEAIERENPTLKGILPKNYADPDLSSATIGGLIETFSGHDLGAEKLKDLDVLGRAYGLFLGQVTVEERDVGAGRTSPSVVRRRIGIPTLQSRLFSVAAGEVVIAAGLVLLAMFLRDATVKDLPKPLHDGAPSGLERYYEQDVTWMPCRGGDCGLVDVPINYSRPQDGSVQLFVKVRLPSDLPVREFIFVNPGGPGGSAASYADDFIENSGTGISKKFGVVGVDPRGVGKSQPIACLSPSKTDDFLAVDPTPETTKEIHALRNAYRNLGRGCRKTDPRLSGHLATANVARDLDIVRALLGQHRLNYYGASYGTQIGATYAHLFANRTGRMVLDGAIDPTMNLTEQAQGQAVGFQIELMRALHSCTRLKWCAWGGTPETAMNWVKEIILAADRGILPAPDRRPFNEGTVLRGIVWGLYNPDRWPRLIEALTAAHSGDERRLRAMADAYDERGPSGFSGNSAVAYPAVRCADFRSIDDYDDMARPAGPGFRTARMAPIFGGLEAWEAAMCSSWPIKPTNLQRKVTTKAAHSILVVGTTRDPATPYAWASGLVRALGKAHLLTRVGDGHTAYAVGNDCVDSLIEGHLSGTTRVSRDQWCDSKGKRHNGRPKGSGHQTK